MAFSIRDFSDIKKLNEEGMEDVFLATQVSLDRKVVIKKLSLKMFQDPKFVKRVENEVRSVAGLDHDNIIRVFDFGEDRSSFFISMEYIDGVDLNHLLRWQPYYKEISLIVLLQAMKGLQYAHKNGIVHGDIKPENILISKTGKVKIGDFGLVTASSYAAEFNDTSTYSFALRYMPPEVISGAKGRDIFMDIWSTGVLAYQIICGKLPFDGTDGQKLLFSIVNENEIDVQTVVPALPGDLASAVRACLEKSPRSRPASLDKMIESLEKYIYDLGVGDIENMVGNYLRNKESVGPVIAGLLSRYHAKKGKEYLDAGDKALSNRHFREAIDQSFKTHKARGVQPDSNALFGGLDARRVPQKQSVARRENPVLFPPDALPKTVLSRLSGAKKLILLIGIIFIVFLGASLVFLMARKNNASDSMEAGTFKTALDQENPSAQDHAANPGSADMGKEPVPVNAPLKKELAIVHEGPKSQVNVKAPEKKKPQTHRGGAVHDLTPVSEPENARLGTLKLRIEPGNANVMIDGEKVPSPELIEGKRLRPGNHVIVVFSDGYFSNSSILNIQPDAIQFDSISLKQREKATGFINIYSYPWAEIYIDDKHLGTTPTPQPLSLPEGDHMLELKRDGFKPHSETVHVARGEVTRIKVKLEQ